MHFSPALSLIDQDDLGATARGTHFESTILIDHGLRTRRLGDWGWGISAHYPISIMAKPQPDRLQGLVPPKINFRTPRSSTDLLVERARSGVGHFEVTIPYPPDRVGG
jgi:hypothetical protein